MKLEHSIKLKDEKVLALESRLVLATTSWAREPRNVLIIIIQSKTQ